MKATLKFSKARRWRYTNDTLDSLVMMCTEGVEALFAVTKQVVYLTVSDKQPRGNNWYAVALKDDIWQMAPSELGSIRGDSNWSYRLDEWATDVLPDGTERAYIWMEQ